ncbi:TetR family transcriptional regulator [Aeromicrobium sp. A1-2]|uniref:TetR/AcrR family transcriptional regulator n=1 Tax=Aeromicrobium sp. A1-2 TaxID=2107713 RepID=UPI000E514EBE|nr:TetR/AcrR family transcriptional regulator [Aeromicrobium sp. A1-2]AXT85440.1 TetR family transcriptional regulator [Aeromicrobium sp. A1-2]
MSTGYEAGGRTDQKNRTRAALVSAARQMVAQGLTPTIPEVADAAAVSRTTAYRYFTSQHGLLAAAHPETDARSLLGDDAPEDPEPRLDAVIQAFTSLIIETESQQRTMLRLSLADDVPNRQDLPLRQGRAIGWIVEALEPVRTQLTDAGVQSLARAIRSATGIEALVWLTDVGGLSRAEAATQMRWAARALLRASLQDGVPVSGS